MTPLHFSMLLAASVVISGIANPASVGAQQATWRRFQNGGHAVASAAWLPTSWTPEAGVAWSAPIEGYGQSTPIVAHNQIVVTSTSGAEKDNYHVTSLAMDGTKEWQVDRPNPSPFKNSPMVSRAAPSAVATQDGFVAFLEGDGKNVFVWVERDSEPYVMAVDPANGDEVWKVPGLGTTSWSSPRLIRVGGQPHLVCSGDGKIVGFDPSSGDRLWEFVDISGNTACTPMPAGDSRFLMGASAGRGDRNAGTAPANNTLIEIEKSDDDTFQAKVVWRAGKASSTFGSPVVAGNTAVFVNRAGVLFRLDLATGEQLSTTRINAGSTWATPIVAGDLMYLFGSKGDTSVISLDDGKEIATNRCWKIESETPPFGGGHKIYAAALAKPYLLIRRGDRLFAVEQ